MHNKCSNTTGCDILVWFVPINVKIWCNGKYLQNKRYCVDEHFNLKNNDDHYGPAINELAFRLPHINILETNHCGKTRHEAFERRHILMGVTSCRDYMVRILYNFAIKSNLNAMTERGCCPKRVLIWTTLSVKIFLRW